MTTNEEEILKVLRSLKPFEKVLIQADKGGRVDIYTLERITKVVMDKGKQEYIHPTVR